eukprot:gene28366-31493_t
MLTLSSTKVTDAGIATLSTLVLLCHVELAHCNTVSDASCKSLATFSSLTHLNLSNCPAITNDGLGRLSSLVQLRLLDLSYASIDDGGMPSLRNMVYLKTLNLDSCFVTDAGCELEEVNLSDTCIANPTIKNLVEAAPTTLRSLNVSYSKVSNIGILKVKGLKQLTYLDIAIFGASNHPSYTTTLGHHTGQLVSNIGLLKLKSLKQLTFLNIDSGSVSNIGLLKLKSPKQLTYLNIDFGYVIDDGIKIFGTSNDPSYTTTLCHPTGQQVSNIGLLKLKSLKQLTYLNIDSGSVSDDGIRYICRLTSLTALDLFGARIHDIGAAMLFNLTNLQRLELCGGCLTDMGAVHIARLRGLTWLSLAQNTRLGDAGVQALARHLTNLESLNLNHTKVTLVSLRDIICLPSLYSLSIVETSVLAEAIQRATVFKELAEASRVFLTYALMRSFSMPSPSLRPQTSLARPSRALPAFSQKSGPSTSGCRVRANAAYDSSNRNGTDSSFLTGLSSSSSFSSSNHGSSSSSTTPSALGSLGSNFSSSNSGNSFSSSNAASTSDSYSRFPVPQAPSANRSLYFDKGRREAKIPVEFCLKYKTNWGEGVKIIGSHANLELYYTAGDLWKVTVDMPPGVCEYKYVVIDYESKQPVHWQAGGNAVLAIDVDERGPVEVMDNWPNAPGSSVRAGDGVSITREDKLKHWGTKMMGFFEEAQEAKTALQLKSNETSTMKSELAQVKMEMSMIQQERLQHRKQIAELQNENMRLQMELTATRQEMNSTLAEALTMLQEELDKNHDSDEYEYEYEDEEEVSALAAPPPTPTSKPDTPWYLQHDSSPSSQAATPFLYIVSVLVLIYFQQDGPPLGNEDEVHISTTPNLIWGSDVVEVDRQLPGELVLQPSLDQQTFHIQLVYKSNLGWLEASAQPRTAHVPFHLTSTTSTGADRRNFDHFHWGWG